MLLYCYNLKLRNMACNTYQELKVIDFKQVPQASVPAQLHKKYFLSA
jgi:hypothetical protein